MFPVSLSLVVEPVVVLVEGAAVLNEEEEEDDDSVGSAELDVESVASAADESVAKAELPDVSVKIPDVSVVPLVQ